VHAAYLAVGTVSQNLKAIDRTYKAARRASDRTPTETVDATDQSGQGWVKPEWKAR
jgi:hypothetical protein